MFAAAWWGILYPELCFTEETCQAVMTADGEDAGKQSDEQQMVSQQITYKDILEATGDDVVVKSRFLEWLEECMRDFSE